MWKLLRGWIRGIRDYGLSGFGMARAGMAMGKFAYGLTYVWILSQDMVQPFTTRGRWDDTESWDDTRLWYD
jgi:hypothetical protein